MGSNPSPLATSTDTVSQFLSALYRELPGLIEVRPIGQDERPFLDGRIFADTPGKAARAISALAARGPSVNTYVGIATRLSSTNGCKTNLAAVRGVFADVDFSRTPERQARDRLKTFGLTPSVIVRSGGGLHPYWLLADPIDLQASGELQRFESILRGIAVELGADPGCAEAARVLRPPGTWNYPTAKKAALGRTLTPVELEFLEPTRVCAAEEFPQLDPADDSPEIQLGDIPAHLPESIQRLIEEDPEITRRWNGSCAGLQDTSRSGVDLSLAALLAHRGHTPDEVAAALLHRPGGKAPGAGSSYLKHTIAKAFKGVDRREISASTLIVSNPQQEDRESENETTSEENQPLMQLPDPAKRGSFAVFIDHMKPVTGANSIHLFGAWLTAVGASIGHSRWGQWSGKVVPIFYSLLVGPTGDHKSTAMSGALKYLPVGVSRISGVTTDAGLFDSLEEAPGKPVLLHFDELGYLLQASRYQGSQLNAMVNDLYSAPAYLSRNLRRRNQSTPPTRTVENPFVCICGGTHTDTFWTLIGDDALAISSGFVNRLAPFLVEKGHSLPITEEPDAKVAQGLRDHLASLSELERRVIELSPEAHTLWIDFATSHDEKLNDLPADLGAVTKRVRDHVARSALIFAVDEGCTMVKVQHLEAAFSVGGVLEAGYRRLLLGRQADSGPRRQVAIERIGVQILRRRRGAWLSARDITHAWPNTANRPHAGELRRALREVDEVEIERGNGKRKERYRVS